MGANPVVAPLGHPFHRFLSAQTQSPTHVLQSIPSRIKAQKSYPSAAASVCTVWPNVRKLGRRYVLSLLGSPFLLLARQSPRPVWAPHGGQEVHPCLHTNASPWVDRSAASLVCSVVEGHMLATPLHDQRAGWAVHVAHVPHVSYAGMLVSLSVQLRPPPPWIRSHRLPVRTRRDDKDQADATA